MRQNEKEEGFPVFIFSAEPQIGISNGCLFPSEYAG